MIIINTLPNRAWTCCRLALILLGLAATCSSPSRAQNRSDSIGGRTGANIFDAQLRLQEEARAQEADAGGDPDGIFEVTIPWDDSAESDDEWWTPSVTWSDGIEIDAQPGGRHLWDVRFYDDCTSIIFSPDGRRLYCGLEDGTVRVVDPATGRELTAFRLAETPIECLAFSARGDRLVAGSPQAQSVFTWDVNAGRLHDAVTIAQPWQIETMQLAPDGSYVVVDGISHIDRVLHAFRTFYENIARRDPNVYAYDTASGQLLFSHRGALHALHSGGLPDGRVLLLEGQVWGFPGDGLSPLCTLPEQQSHLIASCSSSPDGALLAVTSLETVGVTIGRTAQFQEQREEAQLHILRIIDARTGQELQVVRPIDRPREVGVYGGLETTAFIQGTTFSPDGRYVVVTASGYRGQDPIVTVRLAAISDGSVIELPNAGDVISSDSGTFGFAFTPDGQGLAGMVRDGEQTLVRIWDVSPAALALNEQPGTPEDSDDAESDDMDRRALAYMERILWGNDPDEVMRRLAEDDEPAEPEGRRVPAHEAVHIALERAETDRRALDRGRRSGDITAAEFDASLEELHDRLLADFGRIYGGRTAEEAWAITEAYHGTYLTGTEVITDRLAEVLPLASEAGVRITLREMAVNGDSRVR